MDHTAFARDVGASLNIPFSSDMTEPRQHIVQCISPGGLHHMAYREWGDATNRRVLLCVHGLSRVGRDFDDLARALCGDYRVVCPDVVGRGNSGWLANPAHYQIPQYVSDMVTLIARLNASELHWLGTSMGGLIGIGLASLPASPVRKMVLNDVGPILKADALKRIGAYLGQAPVFADFASAEKYIRAVSASFGLTTDAQWKFLTEISLKPAGSGFKMHYDPNIAMPFKQQNAGSVDIELWPVYDAIQCPVLVTRGEHSDLLSRETLAHMAARGPRAATAEIPGVGHAPMFMDKTQIDIVSKFLLA